MVSGSSCGTKTIAGGDDYIGKYGLGYSANGNYSCMNFTWDQAARGEDYPDVYVKTNYEVSGGGNKRAYLRSGACTSDVLWRHTWSEYTDLGRNETTAYHSMNFGEPTGNANARAMNMASAQKFFEIWESYGMTHDIYIGWTNDVGEVYSNGKSCVQMAKQYAVNAFGIVNYDAYRRWDIAPHEIGHCYKDQLMVNSVGGSYPGNHYGFCSYTDYMATEDGWAEFVAMRTWWPDSKNLSQPFYPTTVFTYEIEPGGTIFPTGYNPTSNLCGPYKCASLDCECYSKSEIMAARAFWDIWDNRADNLDTAATTMAWKDMADIWMFYPPGSCNEGCESEYNSNMRDYHHNSSQISQDAYDDIWRVYQVGQSYMVCQGWPVP